MPLIVYISLLIWPIPINNLENAAFPIVIIGQYHIRITEILFWILFLVYEIKIIASSLINRESNCNKRKRRIIAQLLGSENKGWVVAFLLIIMMTVSLIRGIINNNPLISLDLRGLSYCLIIPLIMNATRSLLELVRQVTKIYWVLTILAVINFISIISGTKNSLFQSNNLALILILYLACLSIAYLLISRQKPIMHIIIFIFAITTSLISLAKISILGVTLIILMSSIYAIFHNRRKRIRLLLIYAILTMTITFIYLSGGLDILARNSSFYGQDSNFIDYYENRIKRANIGDISGGRLDIWRFLISEGKNNLLFGSGIGVKREIVDYFLKQNRNYIGEHNIVIYIFLRWGIFGVAIIIYICQRMIRLWIKSIRMATSSANKMLLLSHLLFIIVFLTINMVGLYFTNFETAICFWFSIAVSLLASSDNKTNDIMKPSPL